MMRRTAQQFTAAEMKAAPHDSNLRVGVASVLVNRAEKKVTDLFVPSRVETSASQASCTPKPWIS